MGKHAIGKMRRAATRARGFFALQQLGGARRIDTGDAIGHSARVRGSAGSVMNRQFGTGVNNQHIVTLAAIVKRGSLGARQSIWTVGNLSATYGHVLEFSSTDTLILYGFGTAAAMTVETTQVFRDPSAWYFLVVAIDTTQVTAANRVQFWVNGVQVTSFASASYPAQNAIVSGFDTNEFHQVFRRTDGSFQCDLTVARMELVDGTPLTASSFGRFSVDTGAWVNRNYTGSYGPRGYKLAFNSVTTASDFGIDSSGNGFGFTVGNLSTTAGITYDWLTDTPTNNFCTFNFLDKATSGNWALADGNLKAQMNVNDVNYYNVRGSMALPPSCKAYFEWTIETVSSFCIVGVKGPQPYNVVDDYSDYPGANANSVGWFSSIGIYNNGATSVTGTFATGDIIGVAVFNNQVWMHKNGIYLNSGNPAAGTGAIGATPPGIDLLPALAMRGTTGSKVHLNCGQRPFLYSPPSGFQAICSANAVVPRFARGDVAYDVSLRAGTGAVTTISGKRFSPALVWTKAYTGGNSANFLFDTSRGATKYMWSNATSAQSIDANILTSFNVDGYTYGSDAGGLGVNISGTSYVDWIFRKNAMSGMDIVTYTGTGAVANVPHGLGVMPDMVIVKRVTGGTGSWCVWHKDIAATWGAGAVMFLDSSGNATTQPTNFNSTAPTSAVFSVGTNPAVNNAGDSYVAYLFASVPGLVKVGGYIGNGSADGTFVHTGFRPAFVLGKSSATNATDWFIQDSKRSPGNVCNAELYPDLALPQQSSSSILLDIASNGFKLRNASSGRNASGESMIYLAFAETPFKYANAR